MPKTLFDFERRGYQLFATMKCHDLEACLLAIDMSLGKTEAVLDFCVEDKAKRKREGRRRFRAIVIAPLLVATDTWPTEIAKWRHLRGLTYAVMCGTPAERKAALDMDVDLHFINKENLAWLWQEIGEEDGWFWNYLIIDEASMLKEGRKRTTRAGGGKGSKPLSRFGILARARKLCDRVIEMSGTPSPEGVHDMWGLMYVLDGGDRLGIKKGDFEERWFSKSYNGFSLKPRPGAKEEIMKRCADLMISLRAEDHIELPKVISHPITTKWVEFPDSLMREYKKFSRENYDEKRDIEAVNAAVLTSKQLQWANGSMYRERGNAIWVHDYKLNALEEMIRDLDGHHALIAWSYKFDKEAIRKRFGKKVVFFDEYGKNAIRDWNAGKIVNLAVHPGNISHGTNMQGGGHNLIWYGLQESGETYRQLNMRLPRPGQEAEHVYIRHILARGTRDEDVIANQASKRAEEDWLRDQVRITAADIERELRFR